MPARPSPLPSPHKARPAPTFSFTGNLPPGLSLSSSGVLSGTPTQDGTYTFTITAGNGSGNPVSQTFTLHRAKPRHRHADIADLGPHFARYFSRDCRRAHTPCFRGLENVLG